MTTPKEGPITGLVKEVPFHFPANQNALSSPKFEDMSLLSMLEDFTANAARVVTIPGLSKSIDPLLQNATEELCMRAAAALGSLLVVHPALAGLDFVMIDGTPWADVPDDGRWGKDIVSVSVFWEAPARVVLGVLIGTRKYEKLHTQFHLDAPHARHCVVFNVDLHEHVKVVAEAVKHASHHAHSRQWQLRFMSLIYKAIALTKDPLIEYPVAAANYFDGQVWYVPRPRRHHHVLHSSEFKAAKENGGARERDIGGFLTNHGNFVTRYRAMFMAARRGIVKDTENMTIDATNSCNKEFSIVERGMGGILQEEDGLSGDGYRISTTPLFSEDLW